MKQSDDHHSEWVQRQKDHYDQAAAAFDNSEGWWPRENRNHLRKIRTISGLLGIAEGSVLEVGVGTGIHAGWLLAHSPLRVVGVDLSAGMVQAARARLERGAGDRFSALVADAGHLPFADNSFDAVFCSGTLHHISCPVAALSEMRRVARPGAAVIVMEPNILFPTNLIGGVAMRVERRMLLSSAGNLARWARRAGLAEVSASPIALYTPPFPRALLRVFDRVDQFLFRVPLLRSFSVMIVLRGKKAEEGDGSRPGVRAG